MNYFNYLKNKKSPERWKTLQGLGLIKNQSKCTASLPHNVVHLYNKPMQLYSHNVHKMYIICNLFLHFLHLHMENQEKPEKIRKPLVMNLEFWEKVEKHLATTNENFTVYVIRLIREDLKKRDN